ncbi:extracellular solute-binding protein, partial [bacterium]|nr:extracellular solute-binding protein [bacterium]
MDGKYYAMPYEREPWGLLYSPEILEEYELKVPNTTDELIKLCADYKAKGASNSHYSFIQSYDADYFNYLFPIWWAQYEGVQGYENFFNGIHNNTYSVRIFEQKGREYALEVFEALLDYDKGYLNPESKNQKFVIAQTMFLDGEALM